MKSLHSLPLQAGFFFFLLASTAIVAQPPHGQIFEQAPPGAPPPAGMLAEQDSTRLDESTTQRIDNIEQYERSIAELRASSGPFSPQLAEQMQSLAQAYQANGQHQSALNLLQSAQHIVRINNGLFSLNQLAMVRNMIESLEALNQPDDVARLQEYLYYLNQKNFDAGDRNLQQARIELADWYLQSYLRNPDKLSPFTADGSDTFPSFSAYVPVYDEFSNSYIYVHRSHLYGNDPFHSTILPPGNADRLFVQVHPDLRRARELYQSLLEPGEDQERTALDPRQRRQVQYELLNISYQVRDQIAFLLQSVGRHAGRSGISRNAIVTGEYLDGVEILEDMLSALRGEPDADPRQVAAVQLDLADWHLGFERYQQAWNVYEETRTTLIDGGLSDDEVRRIMMPQPVLFVPRFADRPYSRRTWGIDESTDLRYRGYVDVEFRRDRFGNCEEVTVIDSSENTSAQTKNRVVNLLSQRKARPAFVDGESVPESGLQLRYYYTD